MGWEGRCRRHPIHRESSGVCPACLRDRLTQLSATSSAMSSAMSSPGSSYGSADSSPESNGPAQPPRSRSLIFHLSTTGERSKEREETREMESATKEMRDMEKMKKTRGFWSWLGGGRRKKREKEMLGHAKTFRERKREASSVSWPFHS